MACLVVTEGPAAGQYLALERHPLILVGRDDQCTFQLLDEQVSRRHLQVKLDEERNRHCAIDFDSANGVVVNGQRISGEEPLRDGDAIQIGGTTIVYSAEDFADAQKAMDAWHRKGEWRNKTIVPDPEST